MGSVREGLRVALTLTTSPFEALDTPETIELEFESGTPIGLNGESLSPATLIEALNQRNMVLEERIRATNEALAQAEAARFMVEELDAKNRELEKKLVAEAARQGIEPKALEEFKAARLEIDAKLKQAAQARVSLEARLRDAELAKSAGEAAINEISLDTAEWEKSREHKLTFSLPF